MTKISDERLADMLAYLAKMPDGGNNHWGSSFSREVGKDAAMALTELQSLRSQPAGLRVKGLEWNDRGTYAQVDTILGRYSVQHDGDEPEEWSWKLNTNRRYFCGSLEEAKGAAEADYRQRILSALEPQQEEAAAITELKMTPIAEGLPVRDDLRSEQTILTYNDKVGTWDISFMEAGWDDYDSGFALGVTHWLDITGMWPGVIAQVASYAHPTPAQKVQESQTVNEGQE